MLVHHLMTKSVLIASTIIVWTASAIMNLPYLIAVQYIELNNPETGEKYGVGYFIIVHSNDKLLFKFYFILCFTFKTLLFALHYPEYPGSISQQDDQTHLLS